MFLVATADQRFWKIDEKILFLGEWCKLYKEKHVWSKLDFETLPYHWDDRRKLYDDYILLTGVYEKYLQYFVISLNKIHNVNYSERYWRILIGQWLFYFIQILYDRFLSVEAAILCNKITNTWLGKIGSKDVWIPYDFATFQTWFADDAYNQYLYGEIIKLSKLSYKVIDVKLEPLPDVVDTRHFGIKSVFKKIIDGFLKLIPAKLNQIVLVGSYLRIFDQIILQLSMGQLPYLKIQDLCVNQSIFVNWNVRSRFCLPEPTNQFEKLLNKLLPMQFPLVYLEGFKQANGAIKKSYPRNPKSIYTANAHISNDGFKLWAANSVEQGSRLIVAQHGGHFGSGKWSAIEEHEIKIADYYITWGWTRPEKHVIPMASGKLNALKKIKSKPDGNILWVDTGIIRYSYWMYSIPLSAQFLTHLQGEMRFYSSLSSEVKKLILLRPYTVDYGWNEKMRWKDMACEIKIYEGRKTFYQQLQEARLHIGTGNLATYLEALSANFPSVLFWDPNYWELREEAKPYFDELRRVGILHDRPEAAAEKVNQIYADPMAWWQEVELQKVRQEFCYRFARVSDDWLRQLRSQLLLSKAAE